MTKLGFCGLSSGASWSPILLAIEKRIGAAVVVSGGLELCRVPPLVNLADFAKRVTTPVLMVNGRYDFIYPYEESQKALFDLLGTPDEHKRHYLCESEHGIPVQDELKESDKWFRRYFGPVAKVERNELIPPTSGPKRADQE